jgi:hypothetical protein
MATVTCSGLLRVGLADLQRWWARHPPGGREKREGDGPKQGKVKDKKIKGLS